MEYEHSSSGGGGGGGGRGASVATLTVVSAESGDVFRVELQSKDTVQKLGMRLTEAAGVPLQEQILLTPKGASLDKKRRLSSYEELSRDEPPLLFLIRRAHLSGDRSRRSIVEVPSRLSLLEQQQQQQQQQQQHVLERSASFMMRSLPQFERVFMSHVQQGETVRDRCSARRDWVLDAVRRASYQRQAVQAAAANLNRHLDSWSRRYETFTKHADEQARAFKAGVDGFEHNLKHLSKVNLHSKLCLHGRTTLLDCLPEGKIRAYAHKFALDSASFADKLSTLAESHAAVADRAKEITRAGAAAGVLARLQELADEAGKTTDEAVAALQTLRNDYKDAAGVVARAVDRPEAVNAVEECGRLDSVNTEHVDRLLPLVERLERSSAALEDECVKSLQQMFDAAYCPSLRAVSDTQSLIRGMEGRLALYEEYAGKLGDRFGQVEVVARLPAVYDESLSEIRRRRAFHDAFVRVLSEAAAAAEDMRRKERPLRRVFEQAVGEFVPDTMKFGLDEPLPKVVVRLPNGDGSTSLPLLDEDDDDDDDGGGGKKKKKKEEEEKTVEDGVRLSADEVRRLAEENKLLRAELAVAGGAVSQYVISDPTVSELRDVFGQSTTSALHLGPTEVVELRRKVQLLQGKLDAMSTHTPTASMTAVEATASDVRVAELEEELDEAQQNNAHLEIQLHIAQTQLADEKKARADIERQHEVVCQRSAALLSRLEDDKRVRNLKAQLQDAKSDRLVWQREAYCRIAFQSFAVNDLVLFRRDHSIEHKIAFVAVNSGRPHHYLADESLAAATEEKRFPGGLILGQVVHLTKLVARANLNNDDDDDDAFNPYALEIGTEFAVVTASVLPPQGPELNFLAVEAPEDMAGKAGRDDDDDGGDGDEEEEEEKKE